VYLRVEVGLAASRDEAENASDEEEHGGGVLLDEPGVAVAGKGVERDVDVRTERVRGRVLPRLEPGAVDEEVRRLPVVVGLVAVADAVPDGRGQADGEERLEGAEQRRGPESGRWVRWGGRDAA
jgi:hypothetical protein